MQTMSYTFDRNRREWVVRRGDLTGRGRTIQQAVYAIQNRRDKEIIAEAYAEMLRTA